MMIFRYFKFCLYIYCGILYYNIILTFVVTCVDIMLTSSNTSGNVMIFYYNIILTFVVKYVDIVLTSSNIHLEMWWYLLKFKTFVRKCDYIVLTFDTNNTIHITWKNVIVYFWIVCLWVASVHLISCQISFQLQILLLLSDNVFFTRKYYSQTKTRWDCDVLKQIGRVS